MKHLNDAWFYRVKAAQRDLIKAAGGIDRAADITSISRSQIGRCNNAADPELLTIAAIIQLEAETGLPLVTQAMAEINGRRLTDPVHDAARASELLSQYSDAIRHAGELMSAGAAAFADGKVTPAEAQIMDREAGRLERSLGELRKLTARVQAEGGTKASIRLVGEGGE